MQENNSPISPDGRWVWNGTDWVPNTASSLPGAPVPLPPVAEQPKNRRGLKITGGILAALIVLGIATSGGADEAGTAPEAQQDVAVAPAEEAKAEEAAVPGVGDKVRDGKFEFTVTDVASGKDTYGDGFMAEEAQGSFTIVTLRVENIGDEAQMFTASNIEGIDSKGRKLEAEMGSGDAFLEDINPGNSVTAEVAFDVAKGVDLDGIVVHDSMFSDGMDVAL